MKNYKSKIFIGIGLVTLMAACKKSETFPVDKVSIGYVFDPRDSAGNNAQRYLLGVYQIVRNGHNRIGGDYLDAASDDAVSSKTTANEATTLATGSYQSVDLPNDEDLYSTAGTYGSANYWVGIRNATEFINNIDVVPIQGIVKIDGVVTNIKQTTVLKSEARFLRAYFYFELIKRFGGVPLLGNKIYGINDNLNIPRSSFEDCVNFIVSECDAIKGTLLTFPLDQPNADNYRVTKGAALALKARVLLYAASPLFNGRAAAASKPYLGYPTADPARWAAAASAANDVIALNKYQLDPSFKNIFLTQNDPEVIFIRADALGNNIETNNGPIGFPATGNGNTSPTQELVDAFPMANGLPITDPASGYNPSTPYTGRDPRLTYTIFYNGSPWLKNSMQTFEGGINKPNKGTQQTVTSYYMRKFMGNFETQSAYGPHVEDWIIFRYAEILLNYAEAENEAAGPNVVIPGGTISSIDAIRLLRQRAGIAAGTGDFGVPTAINQSQMRLLIQNERRIEMAFEEQRYFDIRRWKIAETVMNGPRTGVSITTSAGGGLTYTPTHPLITRFDSTGADKTNERMYLYPIPYAEIKKNTAITQTNQNPGW